MKKYRITALSLSALLTFGVLGSTVEANVLNELREPEKMVKVQALDEEGVSKSELIKRFHELFPGTYDFLTEKDFHVHFHRYPYMDEDVLRASLSFHKQLSGNKNIHGNVEFVGDKLEVQHFYFDPQDRKAAMYPAKISMDEAKEVAKKFISNIDKSKTYRMKERDSYSSYWGNRTLTDPIEYEFVFENLHNEVPVAGQEMYVTVLGSGELIRFHTGDPITKKIKFEDKSNLLSKEEVLEKMLDNLGVELRYFIEHKPYNEKADAKLVYIPSPQFQGIHAKDGKWLLYNEFKEELPKVLQPKMLSTGNVPAGKPITRDEAKKLAESLLSNNEADGKLVIEAIYESQHGEHEVFSVQYSYQTNQGGYGSSLEINKNTGEILHFFDIGYYENRNKRSINLSYEDGMKKAVQAIEKFAPSLLKEHSYPITEQELYKQEGMYSYHFPLVKNGIVVENLGIHVSVSTDTGRLLNLYYSTLEIDNWPNPEQVVTNDTALDALKEALDVELYYSNIWDSEERHKYFLLYQPTFKGRHATFDAIKGEWAHPETSVINKEAYPHLENSWAKEQILYLMESNIISEKDPEKILPNQKVTKGQALEVLVKSISYIPYYHYYYERTEEGNQTFQNIDKDHQLYNVVEHAVRMGILSAEKATLNLDETVTREELAVWYIKAMNLDLAAKNPDIFTLPFKDRDKIQNENKGYVALAYSLEIFKGNARGEFSPKEEVTLSQLAVSAFRLAENVAEMNREYYR